MKKMLVFLIVALLFSGGAIAQYNSYRVQHGETLDSLAKKFKVSKQAILKLNPDISQGNLDNKVVVVPHAETDEDTPTSSVVRFKEYKVEKRQTLYNLAKKNDISIKDIKRYNPYLYNEELGENDLIRIPIFRRGKKSVDFNKSVQTSSFKNLIHIVLPKETKYGISKQYSMTIPELDSLNPNKGELKPGQVLKVKNPAVNPKTDYEFAYYEVKPKETFYSLTRRLKISRDSLESLNPILKEEGLKAGMEIKIPKDTGGFASVGVESTQKLDLSQHLNNFSTKKIAVMLPFNLQNAKTDKEKAIESDPVMQISLDFYSGVKAAIDSVQKLGISVDAQVFDTQQSSKKIGAILANTNFDDMQLVIGPLLPDNIQEVARELQNKNIPILSPLTSGDLKGSDKVFQTRPTNLIKQKILITYIDSLQAGKNILILADKEHAFFKNKLMEHFPTARLVKQAKDYWQRSDLTKLLDKDQPNWIIMETKDFGAVSNAVSYMNAIRSSYDIRFFTSDKNDVYDEEIPSQSLSNLNFTFASVDKSDVAEKDGEFVKSYMKTYGITPNQFAVRGFDVTFDALLRLASARDFFESFQYPGTTEYVGNKFNYQKKMIGGYYNNAVYLIKYDKDLKLKIIK